jgi:hypothetical protein
MPRFPLAGGDRVVSLAPAAPKHSKGGSTSLAVDRFEAATSCTRGVWELSPDLDRPHDNGEVHPAEQAAMKAFYVEMRQELARRPRWQTGKPTLRLCRVAEHEPGRMS